ncbi:MAG: ABC transporter ATP-binding protein [Acidobacteria bacterium]|nr:ABC transporter ATP-binding protein [Acidobacteriota bacterium]
MKHFFRVLSIARRHLLWIIVVVCSMLAVAVATVFALNMIRPLYNQVLAPGAAAGLARRAARPESFLIHWLDGGVSWLRMQLQPAVGKGAAGILVLIFGAIVVKNLATFLARYSVAQLGLATIRDLRNTLFEAIVRQGPRFFYRVPSGVLISRVVYDPRFIQEALAERLGDLLQSGVTLAGLLVYLFSLDLKLSLVTLVVAPVLITPIVYFARRLRRRSRQSQERMGDLTTVLDEIIRGMKVIQAFGMEQFEASKFRRATQRHFWASLRARAIQLANAPVMESVGTLGALALIAYASAKIGNGAMTLGDFSAFLLGLWAAYAPVKNLNQFNLALQQAVVASKRVFELIDEPVEIQDLPGARPLGQLKDGISLEGVWFAYDDERWVLRDVNLNVPLGKTVALVGASGAGKSTIAQLIPRFWDPQRGTVMVGGHDVRSLQLASFRARIGVVAQETVLFNDTVRANIAFGRNDISQGRIEAAAKAAFADAFIRALPRGYDTIIGEAGMTLSGGQRQRLAIARALVKDPPILILDEATSFLDPEAERLVQQALDNLMHGRTTLMIAHRLSTVRNADTIVVLEKGRIVQQGSWEELVKSEGPFARLIAMQRLTGRDRPGAGGS